MRKRFLKSIFPLFMAMCLITIGVVSAAWSYADNYLLDDTAGGIVLDMSTVDYAPADILPGTEEDSTNGVNQVEMVNVLATETKNGLNSNKGTLEKLIMKDGIVYSDQKIQGGNLKNLFQTASVSNLVFVMTYSTDTEIFSYTFKDDDRTSATADVTQIQVYKTVFRKINNTWEASHAYKGYATVVYVSSISKNTINPGSWREGEIPSATP